MTQDKEARYWSPERGRLMAEALLYHVFGTGGPRPWNPGFDISVLKWWGWSGWWSWAFTSVNESGCFDPLFYGIERFCHRNIRDRNLAAPPSAEQKTLPLAWNQWSRNPWNTCVFWLCLLTLPPPQERSAHIATALAARASGWEGACVWVQPSPV